MKNIFLVLLIMYSYITPVRTQNTVFIDVNNQGRTYEGTGALSAGASSRLLPDYKEPYRSQILDYLFKPKFGASLNHLKAEIGGDVNSTCGTEPSHQHTRDDANYERGYEFWLMKEAKRRNSDIVLDVLAWGTPGWIGNGHYYSPDNAQYMANFLLGAKRVHNLNIDYIGIWNETLYNTDYIKLLRKTLNENKLSHVQIAAADEIRRYRIVSDMLKDTALYNAVDVVGTHYAGQVRGKKINYETSTPEVINCGKRIWALEDGPWNGEWKGAKTIIRLLIRNYIEAKITKTITWSLISSYHDEIGIPASGLMKANTPWSGHYELQPALWAVAHQTQFTNPGWIYLEGNANGYLKNGGSYVSLTSPDKKDISIIIETVDAEEENEFTLVLKKEFTGRDLYVWRSDSVNQFIRQPEVLKTKKGKLSLTLDKGCIYTLTTTTGQHKGNEEWIIPSASHFKLPYRDDFESYEIDKLPAYFSDISGVFEVNRLEGEGNKVLKQVVPAIGNEWRSSLNSDPYTVIGDKYLTDYEISIDVMLPDQEQSAYIMGRIPNVIQGQVIPPMGYWMKVNTNNTYQLCKTDRQLLYRNSPFREEWKEINEFFPNNTTNKHFICGNDILKLKPSQIALFEGLDNVLATTENPEELVLILFKNGSFRLYKIEVLASGACDFPSGKWNELKLTFNGNTISGYINGNRLCQVFDAQFPSGFAGFGSGFHYAFFDNLLIK